MMFVRTPSPVRTESLLGYLLRVSETNGYDTPWHIYHLAGLSQGQMTSPRLPLGKLAELLGKSLEDLHALAYSCEMEGVSNFKILGHSLGKSSHYGFLRLSRPAFCPLCVQEKGFIDAFWDLSVSIACPDHRFPPQRNCPACAKPLTWFRPGLLRCRCGAMIGHVNEINYGAPTLELMRLLRTKLHNQAVDGLVSSAGFPVQFLNSLPLLSLMQVLVSLGRYDLWGQERADTDISVAIEASAGILSNWPRGYHAFLEKLGARYQNERAASSGLRIQFQPFYQSMFKNGPFSEHIQFLREEFVNFGLQHWGSAVVDEKLLRGTGKVADQRYISKSEYANRYSLSKPKVEQMISDGTIVGKKIATAQGSRVVVDLQRTQPPVGSSGIMTDREAAKQLGLPVSVLRYLRETRVFGTKPRAGWEQSWHRDDVEAFLQHGLALAKTQDAPAETVSLRKVMRIKLRNRGGKGEVVAAIFARQLGVSGDSDGSLGGLLLNKASADKFICDKRRESEGDTFSFYEASRQTSLDPQVISKAIELGFLKEKTVNGKNRVSAESVVQFNSTYVPLSRIARSLGTLTKHLWRMCQKRGFEVLELPRPNKGASQPILPCSVEKAVICAWQKEQLVAVMKSRGPRRQAQIEALRAYLQRLVDRKERLPQRAGMLNKAVIARACGFNRDVLYDDVEAIAMLDAFAARESIRTPAAALQSYLQEMQQRGQNLPLRDRKPNKTAIANACGFHRNVLYSDLQAIDLLNNFVQTISQQINNESERY
jgi:hypothetical protein